MLERIIRLLQEKFPFRNIKVELSSYLYEDIYNEIVDELRMYPFMNLPPVTNTYVYNGYEFTKNTYLPYRSFQIKCYNIVRNFVYNSDLEITEIDEVDLERRKIVERMEAQTYKNLLNSYKIV